MHERRFISSILIELTICGKTFDNKQDWAGPYMIMMLLIRDIFVNCIWFAIFLYPLYYQGVRIYLTPWCYHWFRLEHRHIFITNYIICLLVADNRGAALWGSTKECKVMNEKVSNNVSCEMIMMKVLNEFFFIAFHFLFILWI